eukprot:4653418-Pyramimonas_sp.AAC.1
MMTDAAMLMARLMLKMMMLNSRRAATRYAPRNIGREARAYATSHHRGKLGDSNDSIHWLAGHSIH